MNFDGNFDGNLMGILMGILMENFRGILIGILMGILMGILIGILMMDSMGWPYDSSDCLLFNMKNKLQIKELVGGGSVINKD